MPTIRPFRFAHLPQYSAQAAAVHESLGAYLSYRPYEPSFRTNLEELIGRYLKVGCHVGNVEVQATSEQQVREMLPEVGCLLCIGAAPGDHQILVDLDTGLVSLAIERLLGGAGDSGRILRPLTEIEQGVLSFIILHVLAACQGGLHDGNEIALVLNRFATRATDVDALLEQEGSYQLLATRISAGKRVGYVRMFIPDALVSKRFAASGPTGTSSALEHPYMRRLHSSLGALEVTARVELASLDLDDDDIANLEAGDIVVVENHQLTRGTHGFEGQVFVRFGAGRNGGLRARLSAEGDRAQLHIEEIVLQEIPQEESAMDDDDMEVNPPVDEGEDAHDEQTEGDNLAETEGLLRDVAAPVVVELGRLTMNTAQVIRLRQGQILRLPRGPADPVDLVVNDKLFARGELIEVDGELGVRLLQIVGAG